MLFRSWHSILWKEEQDYIHGKYLEEKGDFWNWNYFGREFFQTIIKILLKGGHTPYQLFASFKKHINESVEKLSRIEDKKEKDKYDHYITGLFASFCPTFFNEIGSAPSSYDIWRHYFPSDWKVLMTNTKNGIPRVILHEFLQWSRDRIFKDNKETDFDKSLTEVINGIFPNIHSSLFTAFLMLFFSGEVKYALGKEPGLYLKTSVSWSGSTEESKEEMDKGLSEMMNEKAESQKKETINIILNFFSHHWDKLKITLNDNNKDAWESANNKDRESMLKAARKEKLEKIKTEIESNEVKKVCKDDERRELYRKEFLELTELLLKEIEK